MHGYSSYFNVLAPIGAYSELFSGGTNSNYFALHVSKLSAIMFLNVPYLQPERHIAQYMLKLYKPIYQFRTKSNKSEQM